ncbi:MAG: sigma 54-interacting transcriptional regulator [Desulfobulbaceae bacterium]|nr:sigma 54-interacting transcriptional regulator [Desulfobulbaceae bacterium]
MPGLRNIIEATLDQNLTPITIRPFPCPHCGQKYTPENLNLAVIIYGVFFLTSDEDGHFGFTCPNCIKTVLISDTSKNIHLSYKYFTTNSIVTADTDSDQLRYNSFPRFSDSDFPPSIRGSIRSESLMHSEISPDDPGLAYSLDLHQADYYSGYIYNTNTTGGTFPTLWWFRKGSLKELVDFECQGKISVFPRYIYRNQTIQWCNEFCWNYSLIINYLDYIHKSNQEREANPEWKEEMEGYAAEMRQLDSIGEDITENEADLDPEPGGDTQLVGMSVFFEPLLEESKRAVENSYHKTVEFTDILLSDSIPFKPQSSGITISLVDPEGDTPYALRSKGLQNIFRSRQPFKGKGVPENLKDIKPSESNSFVDRKSMSDRLVANFHKEKTQKLLSDAAERFIIDYVDLATRTWFSYGQVWHLKQRFLQQVSGNIYSPEELTLSPHKTSAAEAAAVREAESQFPGVHIISNDPEINRIKIGIAKKTRFFRAFQDEEASFLLLGERGTGKELFAKAIHEASGRKGELVTADCGAISEDIFETEFFGAVRGAATGISADKKGYFEQAEDGTIFFDEIGNLLLRHQPKLLRAIESRMIRPVGSDQTRKGSIIESNAIFIFATNRNLEKMVSEGLFLPDLYDRINKITFPIPPLRNRPTDIAKLSRYFIDLFDKRRIENPELPKIGISQDCLAELNRYEWPGNVRKLKVVMKGIMINRWDDNDRSDIGIKDLRRELPPFVQESIVVLTEHHPAIIQRKRRRTDSEISSAYKKLNHNISQTAELLGIGRETVRRRLTDMSIYKKSR